MAKILSKAVEKIKEKGYRVRDNQRKLVCPHPDYPNAFIVLPREWLGEHAIRKDRALQLTRELGRDISNFAVCMSVLDDWGNIPGLDEKNTDNWNFNITPIPIIQWVVGFVLVDFSSAYIVPKDSSPPSSTLSQEKAQDMDGDSEKKA